MAQQKVSIWKKPELSVVYDYATHTGTKPGQAAVYRWFRPIKKGQHLLKDKPAERNTSDSL
jgi:hypothetical protein